MQPRRTVLNFFSCVLRSTLPFQVSSVIVASLFSSADSRLRCGGLGLSSQSVFLPGLALRTVTLVPHVPVGAGSVSPSPTRYLFVHERSCYSTLLLQSSYTDELTYTHQQQLRGGILPANSSRDVNLQGFNPLVARQVLSRFCGLLLSGEWNYITRLAYCQHFFESFLIFLNFSSFSTCSEVKGILSKTCSCWDKRASSFFFNTAACLSRSFLNKLCCSVSA